MKVVDTREYLSVLKELVEEGKEVSMLIAGSSMSPFLGHERDYIYFRKPEAPIRRGDMVFYQRRNGQYIMHRVWKVKDGQYYMVGDAQTEIEGSLERDQIFAVITKVKRKGKWCGPGDFWWEFFEKVWIRIVPLRRLLVRLYGIVYKLKKRK
ncbi:MAG: S24/S26 family peptidase [Schaedlerella sp.]|nr:S24/S26 family peptidase [Schaedlerella sp.]